MPGNNKFREDLEDLVKKLSPKIKARAILNGLMYKLTLLHKKGRVKINHSVMEIVVAHYLLRKGYVYVDVEHIIGGNLICDVYGIKGDGSIIVEVETGFTPPESSLDPFQYLTARIASKIARYGAHAEKFSLATPPFYTPPIHPLLLKPPRERSRGEIKILKSLLDKYYKNPPISEKDIQNARLHSILIVNVDLGMVEEIDPEHYIEDLKDIYWKYISSYTISPH